MAVNIEFGVAHEIELRVGDLGQRHSVNFTLRNHGGAALEFFERFVSGNASAQHFLAGRRRFRLRLGKRHDRKKCGERANGEKFHNTLDFTRCARLLKRRIAFPEIVINAALFDLAARVNNRRQNRIFDADFNIFSAHDNGLAGPQFVPDLAGRDAHIVHQKIDLERNFSAHRQISGVENGRLERDLGAFFEFADDFHVLNQQIRPVVEAANLQNLRAGEFVVGFVAFSDAIGVFDQKADAISARARQPATFAIAAAIGFERHRRAGRQRTRVFVGVGERFAIDFPDAAQNRAFGRGRVALIFHCCHKRDFVAREGAWRRKLNVGHDQIGQPFGLRARALQSYQRKQNGARPEETKVFHRK